MTEAFIDRQMDLFPREEAPLDATRTSTFSSNMSLPIHRWFRYSAGFSAKWIRQTLQEQKLTGRYNVLDPFAGSGTTLLEGEFCGTHGIGIEAHPFIARVAQAKLHWREDPGGFANYGLNILHKAKGIEGDSYGYPDLVRKCFQVETIAQLDSIKKAWEEFADGSPYSDLAWLAMISILRECSHVGTAQWQYVLPKKSKMKAMNPFDAYQNKVSQMHDDMVVRQTYNHGPIAFLFEDDARKCSTVPERWADLVITSPPYINNYDYADATRLEMTYTGDIEKWGDLQDKVRKYLLRSCTQHVAKQIKETYIILEEPILEAIRDEAVNKCRILESERENHGGKKPYHTMIAAYFLDMAQMWVALRRVTSYDSLICFVIGDSAPYGIHIPVEEWLGKLALSAGFKSFSFEKTRDRNIKWENRKHRVPLHEGRLWIKG